MIALYVFALIISTIVFACTKKVGLYPRIFSSFLVFIFLTIIITYFILNLHDN